ncbi:hypothetical protein ATANTOWER_015108 [Ataeniobius toweri]|uniref:Uncharacterized protein n=1 Tax=Ataeniobius toweri TaxID=208326 RepID=A0ABU7AQC8_9TELE|nr:hypothetical protein [Ataeniobius toweri]
MRKLFYHPPDTSYQILSGNTSFSHERLDTNGTSRAAWIVAALSSPLHALSPPSREGQGVFLRSFSPAINVWDFPMKTDNFYSI